MPRARRRNSARRHCASQQVNRTAAAVRRLLEPKAMTTGEQAPLDAPLLGLSSIVAAERLRSNGKNELPPPKRVPAWRQIVAQLTHFFAILLWVAGLLALIGGMPELGVAIFVVIVM